ncbi:diguanylate cyclase/phosphodiesterase [Paenibacillus curdlanolyticus YK9]|uniref:Diguanylate cyclase/phosphodiesterase n=1 Tax=Paenibacillus curdlanolyticus YK9 TaxID=717606 RepID=E0IBP2_9BACL|nr:sensor domain-containing phosphodiesterase [Paenibacillus curdlanolyticus]EFM10122.1 diguanylate cyclase/phosphodiesterase [Paenibacillus curdlanolyticus YK9]
MTVLKKIDSTTWQHRERISVPILIKLYKTAWLMSALLLVGSALSVFWLANMPLALGLAGSGICMSIVAATQQAMAAVRTRSSIALTGMQHNPLPFLALDRTGAIIQLNEAAAEALGYERHSHALVGELLERYVDSGDLALLEANRRNAYEGKIEQATIGVRSLTGMSMSWDVLFAPVGIQSGTSGCVLIAQDMSERKRHDERVKHMAFYDDMTGLPNRRLFVERLGEMLAEVREPDSMLAVCCLDIDHFKLINASYGHDYGDMLLLQMADRLLRGCTDVDFVCRMDGDKFGVILAAKNSEGQIEAAVQSLLSALEEPFELQGIPIQLTASAGWSSSAQEPLYPDKLLRNANLALIKAKENGRNECLIYREEWDEASLERLRLQHDLRRAVANREFVLLYQPQYDMNTGDIVGVEALLRWHHPLRGLVQPSKFIPLAEESGVIVQIGQWVLEEACRQNKSWQDAGLAPIPVSVNLSMRQFWQPNFTASVEAVLTKVGLEPRYLELEITESMTMDPDKLTQSLNELTALGISISIDDFGTGYSSFHYLKHFPVDRLKIDRSFVSDIEQDPGDAEIVAAIIAMAHNLNMQVIAEGVETAQQVQFLKMHLCDEMQGYYGSPPVTSERIAEMLVA